MKSLDTQQHNYKAIKHIFILISQQFIEIDYHFLLLIKSTIPGVC